MGELLLNRYFRPDYRADPPTQAPLELHRRLPWYQPTPLRSLEGLAGQLGLGTVHLKDEADRLGLPAYKVLGAVWATARELARRLEFPPDAVPDLARLRERLGPSPGLTLVAATDGNHGRGVARVARWLGLAAEICVPEGTAASRIEGIRSEGARVVEVPGTYDDAVARAAASRGEGVVLIQDHGWPGYEEIPGWVADGYETIFAEVDAQLEALGAAPPDLVLIQIGVGTLASAAVRHFRRPDLERRPVLVGVEPTGAACALRSIAAGHPVMLEAGAHSSIMAGLNCGTPSSAAWPYLRAGMEAFVALEDDVARAAMRHLAAAGVVAGESGAAGLAGLLELMAPPHHAARVRLGIGPASHVLLLSTEGATDPEAYAKIVTGERRAVSSKQ